MARQRFLRFGIILVGASVLLLASLARITAQENPNARITSPKAGDALIGIVSITGTANHPNFQYYTLEFDRQDIDTEQWLPIASQIRQQVRDGTLAQWNTTSVPDGRYQIRLRLVLRDGNVTTEVVKDLRVSNREPTALPTPQPAPTLPQPTLPPTAGPSPTLLIQQPPTATPRAALPTVVATVIPISANPEPPRAAATSTTVLTFDSLTGAFCSGIYLALAIFVLFGVVIVGYRRARPMLRQVLRR